MKVVIYACSSRSNKRERLVDLGGQIDSCIVFAENRDFQITKDCMYIDEIVPTHSHEKKRLQDLLMDAKSQKFDLVLVENIQILSINEIKILDTIIKLNCQGIKLVPVNNYSMSIHRDSRMDCLSLAA